MTLVFIKGRQVNICMNCGNKIINRYRNADYCKECSERVRKENCRKAMKKFMAKQKANKKNGRKTKK